MTRDEIATRLGWTRNDMVDVVEKIVQAAVDAEREKVAAWMIERGYATGHGDTVEDLLKELEWQAKEREREACAKVCEKIAEDFAFDPHNPDPTYCAVAIRARGQKE